jgi:hypothetical protein
MKIGPQYSALGLNEGIHWHINPDVTIEYVAADESREDIVQVKYTDKKTGKSWVFQNEEEPVADSTLRMNPSRVMDCMDCHNRPSHMYKAPQHYIDDRMITGKIPSSIPMIKRTAMEILKNSFSTVDSAYLAISDGVTSFYKENYPDYYAANKAQVDQAIQSIEDGYSKNTFPVMKVSYDKYPDHIGHLESRGCFRCHNGKFKTPEGKVIPRDCNLCHTIIGQGKPGSMQMVDAIDTLEFRHPVEIRGVWKTSDCSECHSALFQ